MTCRDVENSTRWVFDMWVPLEGTSTLTGQDAQMPLLDENIPINFDPFFCTLFLMDTFL